MTPQRKLNERICAEIDALVKKGILLEAQASVLKARYPTAAWDAVALVRRFTILGGVVAALGVCMLLGAHIQALFDFLRIQFAALIGWLGQWVNWWVVAEIALAGAGAGLLAAGHRLRRRTRMPVTGEVVQLVGCFVLQGLITMAAARRLDGENWPLLMGVQTAILIGIAYLVVNRLVLWYGGILFFFWFGAQTGYVAGWGCYWLGMTYPVRYLMVGALTLLLAWVHGVTVRRRWTSFSRVYAHYGCLVMHLAFWFLSLFGYYEDYDTAWSDIPGQRLTFSLLWGAFSVASVLLGAMYGLKLARGYGLTFGILNLYTFYFQFMAVHSGELWYLHMLLVGGSLVALAVYIERNRNAARCPEEHHADASAPDREAR